MQSLVSFMELLPLVAFHCFSCHFSFPYPTENLLDRKERVSECLLINCTGSPSCGSIQHLVVSHEWMICKIYTKRKKTYNHLISKQDNHVPSNFLIMKQTGKQNLPCYQ